MSEKTKTNESRQVTYNIHQHLGSLGISRNGWTKEINIVSWNEGRPLLDIRDWSPEHDKMSRGIGLNEEEVLNFLALMQGINVKDLGI